MRPVHIRAAVTGEARLAMYEGRSHLVVPVIALMEGVVHASNAPSPEFVPEEALLASAAGWNGRPAMMNHPERNGMKVSANDPLTLERESFGRVFAAQVSRKRLLMEAWLDLTKAPQVPGAQEIVDRLRARTMVEVSVGAFVSVDDIRGRWAGHDYRGVWKEIVPDHLALLPQGMHGACSVEMGCGAMRAASEGGTAMCEQDCECIPPPRSLGAELRAEYLTRTQQPAERDARARARDAVPLSEDGVPLPPKLSEILRQR